MTNIPGIEPQVLPADVAPPASDQAAMAAGQKLGATLVVYGTYQIMDPNVRIIAKMVDVSSGRVVGSMQATGDVRDLFTLEDLLSQQAYQLAAQQ